MSAATSPGPRNLSPYQYFLDLARSHEPAHRYVGGDVERWREAALPAVLATLGEPPDPVPAQAELIAEWTEGRVTRQRWVLDVQPGLAAVAYVNRPADLPDGERRAGILCWHGHGRLGKELIMGNRSSPELAALAESTGSDFGLRMAEAGFVTFALDWMGQGDRDDAAAPHHHDLADGRDWCNLYYLHATMLGMTPLGMNVAHGRALTDFVTTLPFVDAARLGVMGESGGGTLTLWSALTDARFRAAEIICYSDLFADFGYRDVNYCGSQITPGLYGLVDVPDLQGLLAPRPLLVDIGLYDTCFRVESALACHERVRTIYRAADADDVLELDLFPGGHGWDGRRSMSFFERHLAAAS